MITFQKLYEDSSVASLRSSILEHQVENGRTYHSIRNRRLIISNNCLQRENDRLDFQHRIWQISLDEELALAPGHKTAKRVLDIGTGTGIWAIDYGTCISLHEVIGVDLSPIQPEWAPPNCRFEIDDVEKDWTWTEPFDFIFCRGMTSCFADPAKIAESCYKALTPGGWLEFGELIMPLGCDDDTVPADSHLRRWHELATEAAEKLGRPMKGLAHHTKEMEEMGFVNITAKDLIWPLNSWPKDEKLSEIGKWQYVNLDSGLEAMSMALLTRAFDWSKEEVLALCAHVRKDLKNKGMHAYWNM
ncbi:methyltransferase domain-containing protein [Colletotrichum truncatum]|uniref:Methyltransferase domain-containing protein n=1 Tax=Colletotrichum truncatum TaxID=5467 RepID=A0ACC3Z6B6_COLTU